MSQAQEQLRLLKAAVDQVNEAIVITTAELNQPGPEIVFVNPAFTQMTGYSAEEVIGKTPRILQGSKTDRDILNNCRELLALGERFSSEIINYRKDGTEFDLDWNVAPIKNASGETTHYISIQRDITSRKRAEVQLLQKAFHDSLTGLPNRTLFMERLGQAVEYAKRHEDYLFALLFVDLDRFKVVNDSLGHQLGDQLLRDIALRLKAGIRPMDTVARLGGDEFTILVPGIQDVGDALRVAERVQKEIALPFALGGQEVVTTASIGISISATSHNRPEDLLRNADIAMYRAKALGKARYEIFDADMHAAAVARLQLEADLRNAIERQEFCLQYQPIVSLSSGRIIGFEALLRWQRPQHGLQHPAEFILVAEETGLLTRISQWVFRVACIKLYQWQLQFPTTLVLTMNVNLFDQEFTQPNFVDQIQQILQETGLAASSLRLEITENGIMKSAESATAALFSLRDLGVQLSIDDFGAGYSSLARLHCLPINGLKINPCFVAQVGIVDTIITLAGKLRVDVTAEGVETKEQLTLLRELKCEYGQGYFFSKPLDSKAAEALLVANPQW